jgi:ent-kaurene oxidase
VMRWVVGRISARTFIGYPACRNDKWVQTSLDFTRDVFGLTFIMHWFPNWMTRFLLPLTRARWRLDQQKEYAYQVMAPAVKDYEEALTAGTQETGPCTLLEGMLKDAKGSERDMREIVTRQMLSSLASIHTSVMTAVFCLLELCHHPEYIEPLTHEAKETLKQEIDWARHSTTRLPMMDSFIMEVLRLHPPSRLIPQRKAREAFTLSNGIHVPVGTHFGFPLGPVTHDPERFPNPEQFDAFRNYRKREAEGSIGASSKYMATTPTEDHLVFGHGSQACPGRFFAVNEIKLILLFFLLDFEFKQPESQKASRLHFPFEEYLVLNPMLKLMMKRKPDSVFK